MKFNLLLNVIFQSAAGVIQFANLNGSLVPAKYQGALATIVGVAQIIVSIKAHYTNPDGSSARLPYEPSQPDPPMPKMKGPVTAGLFLVLLLPAVGRAQAADRGTQGTARAGVEWIGDSKAIEPPVSRPSYLPDPKWTPGATNPKISQANIGDNVCKKGWSTRSIRPPAAYTTRLKIQQLRAYGYTDTKPGDYEEDHLISLEIGGSPTDPKNLWPEPYSFNSNGKQMGARQKDKIEDRLHVLVCNGTLTLEQAQELIAKDWTAAYRKYIGEFPDYIPPK
jgi:hypothetical protein